MRADDLSLEDKHLAPTIPGEFVFHALEAFRHRGRNHETLLGELGFDSKRLSLPGYRVSVIDYATLIERIIVELNDGFAGFIDDDIPVKAFSVYASQLAGCENVTQMIQQLNRFYALFTDQFRIEIVDEQPIAKLVLHFDETQDFDYQFIYQSILIMLVRMISWFVGMDIRFEGVQFSFPRTHLDKHLHYLFDCPITYGASYNEIHLDAELLTIPCSTTLKQVSAMLKDSRWMMLISHKSKPFTREVRKALILHREKGWLSVADIAERMSLSKNLLWRKLKKENTSFLQIRDEVKRDYVLSLMNHHELSVSDIAIKTGFADVSSFNKAFTKWTGQSPSKYRRSLIDLE